MLFRSDNLNACQSAVQTAALSGVITTESRISVANVVVMSSNGTQQVGHMSTDDAGSFSFNNLAIGQKTSLSAAKDDDYGNGVTTYDIALLSRHILDIKPLNTPYKIIAADVNHDGDVSAVDMLLMRRLVLKIITIFPNNTSWRFLDKKYIFSDPLNPLNEDFSEIINNTFNRAATTQLILLP